MKRVEIQVPKKQRAVYATLFLSFFILFLTTTLQAEPFNKHLTVNNSIVKQDQANDLILFAGEVSSGEPEAVLQFYKTSFLPLLRAYLHTLFSESNNIVAAPIDFQSSKGDCGLHTILTKGP